MCQAVQKCVHVTLGKFFKWWAQKLIKRPCCVFSLTIILFMIISKYSGFRVQLNVLRSELHQLQVV